MLVLKTAAEHVAMELNRIVGEMEGAAYFYLLKGVVQESAGRC